MKRPGRKQERAGNIHLVEGSSTLVTLEEAVCYDGMCDAGISGGRGTGGKRNRRIRRVGPLVGLVSLLAAALLWATHSRYFSIRTILVEGNHLVSAKVIQKNSGILCGSNLLLASTHYVRSHLSNIPAIKEVRLERRFPHTLLIKVSERTPWAAVKAGKHFFLVDSQFQVIAREKCQPVGLPLAILHAPRPSEVPALGTTEDFGPLAAALGCLRTSTDRQFGMIIPRVFIDGKRNIWLNVNGRGKVMFGPPENLGAKLSVLRTIVRGSPSLLTRAQFVDLQNPDVPAYLPRVDPQAPTRGTG